MLDAMRLLADFQRNASRPRTGKIFKNSSATRGEFARSPAACAAARKHAWRLRHRYDSSAGEPVEAGQAKSAATETSITTSGLRFSVCRVWPHPPASGTDSADSAAETESREDSIFSCGVYVIARASETSKDWMAAGEAESRSGRDRSPVPGLSNCPAF